MADDGMLVNFDIGPDAFAASRPLPKFKGGKWTDRHRAKKLAAYHVRKKGAAPKKPDDDGTGEFNIAPPSHQQPQTAANPPSSSSTTAYDRALKRKRPTDPAPTKKPNGTGVPPPGAKPGEFVSSLWTQNPASVHIPAVTDDAPEPEAQEPTNAPISDGSATFTTLGLSPALANHLTTKLSLKNPTAIQKAAIPELIKTDSDAFIQAETGSGKTLTYLLPIVHRIMALSKPRDAPDGKKKETMARHSGLYAIILAPTRELSRQIETVLTTLIHAKNGPHWIVPGSVIGGEKKKSEKARLRKGLNILVATPGRLLDHLENTESLDVSRVRWVVMDEGDRLMELGFEETIGSILAILEKKSKLPSNPSSSSAAPGGEEALPKRRVTVLCSATMKPNVQRLGDISLKDALYIKAEKSAEDEAAAGKEDGDGEGKFTAPAQLKQSYAVVPAKQRLVALMAVLKRAFIRQTATPRVMVFFSCSDSVDFHFEVFSRALSEEEDAAAAAAAAATTTTTATIEDSSSEDESESEAEDGKPNKNDKKKKPADKKKKKPDTKKTKKPPAPNPATSPAPTLHPTCLLHKLHGSLPQPIRTAALHSFTHTPHPTILFCTDVAARGLDLPSIDLIIQHDPPFAPSDHLHRIGRTARAGRPGRAIIFLLPGAEEGYVDAVLKRGVREGQLARADVAELLRKGFSQRDGEARREWEDRASEWQLGVERWIAEDPQRRSVAARAWGSHIRAYATHVGAERSMFSVKGLHYGHLAKSFGLRDRPGDIKVPGDGGAGAGGSAGAKSLAVAQKRGVESDEEERDERPGNEAMRKMRKIAQGMLKKRGMADEFNIG